MPSVSHTADYRVSIEAMYQAFADYASYPDFLEHFERIEVLEEVDGGMRVQVHGEMFGPVSYVIDVEFEAPRYLAWAFVEGKGFNSMEGACTFEDLGRGLVRVEYAVDVSPRVPVPGFIVKQFLKQQTPALLDRFHARALEIQRR
jgi:ribosome-associated toxin RatA of RatAB toxin-antitoxin module